GAARVLTAHRHNLAGDVVFMFQPGEEGHDGARFMVDEGVLDAAGRRVDAALALHVTSSMLPAGFFASRAGTIMSAADTLRATVRSYTAAAHERLIGEITGVCEGIGRAHGVDVDAVLDIQYPVTVNAADQVDLAHASVADHHGDDRWITLPDPLSGSEDFSRV